MSTTLHSADDHHAMRPPQFGLRAMFIGMTVLGASFALFAAIGLAISAMLTLFVALVILHVVGNALGMRLRDGYISGSSGPTCNELNERPLATTAPVVSAARRLQENTAIRRPWLIAAAIGAAIFGTLGGIGIAAAVGKKLTIAGLALGIGSSAALGGMFGFMVCSLWSVARTAWREALETLDESETIVTISPNDKTNHRE